MKKANSIRRTPVLRRRQDDPGEGRLGDLDDFEEVALDASRETRPVFQRSATARSNTSVTPSTTTQLPTVNAVRRLPPPVSPSRAASMAFDDPYSRRSTEALPLDTVFPNRINEMRESRLSSASLPSPDIHEAASQLRISRNGTSTRQIGKRRVNRRRSSDFDHGNESEEIPDSVFFDNVPISPQPFQSGFDDSTQTRYEGTLEPDPQPTASRHSDECSISEEPLARPGKLPRPRSYHESLLNDMDADTRELTAQLNDHAQRSALMQEPVPDPKVLSSSVKSRSDRKASAKAIAKNLKPTIDHRIEALPISKEKEAMLACTRPTHLPPKSKKEEKKHIKEYEKLVFSSLEADKKSQKMNSKLMNQKARHLTNSADTWTNQILPHFATAVKDPRTKVLWWSGLPNRVRGRIWSICIGNTLTVNEETFKVALSKSLATERELKARSDRDSDEDDGPQLLTLDSYKLLETSVDKTFVSLKIFQVGGPLHESLVQVLKAYLYYRQDVMVSYIEGVNYIAGLLLLYLPPVQTFTTMVNVLNRALPLALYTRDEPVLNRFVAIFLTRLSQRLPRLYQHLNEELRLPPLTYLEPMLICFLAKQAPIDISSRIFDIYAFEGDAFLLRAVIGVFVCLEHALYGSARDVLTVLSGTDKEHTWEKNLREDDFIRKCRTAF